MSLTDRLYQSLPAFYRDADEQVSGEPLHGFLSLLGDQADDVETLVDRIDFVRPEDGGVDGDTSDLVDPSAADGGWLPWLAQFVGIIASRAPESFADPYAVLSATWATYADLTAAAATYADLAALTTTTIGGDLAAGELRARLASGVGFLAGTDGFLKSLIRPLLTGVQVVRIERHVGGDPWAVRVITYAAETPAVWQVERVLGQSDVKPAGVDLQHLLLDGATYADLSDEFATYSDLDAEFATYADQHVHVPGGP